MPLSINVGLSRKASKDYQSTGASINVTAELDQSLLARPDELQQQIAALYAQAEQALDCRAAAAQAQAPPPPGRGSPPPPRANGHGRNGNGRNGHGNGHANGNGGGGMTESQRRAILAIARCAGADAAYEAEQVVGTPLDDLTVAEASTLIDHLKSISPAHGH